MFFLQGYGADPLVCSLSPSPPPLAVTALEEEIMFSGHSTFFSQKLNLRLIEAIEFGIINLCCFLIVCALASKCAGIGDWMMTLNTMRAVLHAVGYVACTALGLGVMTFLVACAQMGCETCANNARTRSSQLPPDNLDDPV